MTKSYLAFAPLACSKTITTFIAVSAFAFAAGAMDKQDKALTLAKLKSDGGDVSIVENFRGQPLAAALTSESGAGDKALNASLALNAKRLYPLSPVIPPYIGAEAKAFKALVLIESQSKSLSSSIELAFDGNKPSIVWTLPTGLGFGDWVAIDIPAEASANAPLLAVSMRLKGGPGATAVAYLSDPRLDWGNGKTYRFLTPSVPKMTEGCDKPLGVGAAKALPSRDCAIMGGYRVHDASWRNEIPAMLEFMKSRYPDADFVLAPVWTPQTPMAEILKELPEGVFFQFQKAQMDSRFLSALDAMPKDQDGKPLVAFSNSVLATHPIAIQGWKDEIDYAASLGINSFKQVDYGWPWHNAHMGYDKASVDAFRQDLEGSDEGLSLLAGLGGLKAGLIHFLDYFEENHGVRLKPEDLGLSSWRDFAPSTAKAAAEGGLKEKLAFSATTALVHYECLRQAQRFGRWAKAHGGKHDFTLNPEDVGNGGDYLYLLRLADVGDLFFEYFGSPSILQSAYAVLPCYRNAAEKAGRKFGVITEIGQGGHGQNYWDPEVGYLAMYELAALGAAHYHNEWMEAPWSIMSNSANAYHFDRFAAWVSQADGWRQARRGVAFRPAAKVFNITQRSSVNYIQAWPWSLEQMDSFGSALADANLDFEQSDCLSMPDVLAKADIVFYAPPASRQSDFARLREWLERGGKTLVTHSYIPFSIDKGEIRVKKGVERIDFRGEEFNYSDYIDADSDVSCDAPLHPAFSGTTRLGEGYWQLPSSDGKEKTVMQSFGPKTASKKQIGLGSWRQVEIGYGLEYVKPTLSEIEFANGSRIVYLHCRPQSVSPKELVKIIDKMAVRYKIPMLAQPWTKGGSHAIVHIFKSGNLQVATLWNEQQLVKLGFAGGNGANLLPGRGIKDFDLATRPYPYSAIGEQCAAAVKVQCPGKYRVYDFLENQEGLVDVGEDLLLPLVVKERIAGQFYYALDSEQTREDFAGLSKARAKAGEFFLESRLNRK